jgi:hypothetical protein
MIEFDTHIEKKDIIELVVIDDEVVLSAETDD